MKPRNAKTLNLDDLKAMTPEQKKEFLLRLFKHVPEYREWAMK